MATPKTAVFEFDPVDLQDAAMLRRLQDDRPVLLYGIMWKASSIRLTVKGKALVSLKALPLERP